MALNSVNVQGRLVKEPELRMTSGGKDITEFSIAVNDGKRVDYVPVIAWGKNAINICNFLKKGSELVVQGKLQNDRWEDKNGNKQSKLKILCSVPHFTAQNKSENQSTGFAQSGNQYGSEPPIDFNNAYCPDDDLPF